MHRWARVLSSATVLFSLSTVEPSHAEGSYSALVPPLPSTKLDNGLRVVFAHNPRSTRVTVSVLHPVGTSDEPRRGVWDLLYRLAWNYAGTKNMSIAEVDRALHDDGIRTEWNWRRDTSASFVDAPSSHLARAVWAASEPMAYLFDGMNEATYQRAVKAIVDARNREDESETIYETVDANVWPAGHLYHRDPRSSDEEIAKLSLADAKRIHRACIVPNNATVIVAGNFDRSRAEDAVRKYFGPIPSSGVEHPCRKAVAGTLPTSRAVELTFESGGRTAFVEFAWSTPAFFESDDAALDVAASAIRDRLDDRLVDNMRVAARVWSNQESYAAGSMFSVRADVATGHGAGEVRRAVEDEVSRILRDGLSNDEVATARRKVLAQTVSVGEPLVFSRRIAHTLAFDDGLEKFARDPDRYTKLDTAAVVAAIRKYLGPERRVGATVELKSGAPIQGRLVNGGKR